MNIHSYNNTHVLPLQVLVLVTSIEKGKRSWISGTLMKYMLMLLSTLKTDILKKMIFILFP